jgi:hypothetical protein
MGWRAGVLLPAFAAPVSRGAPFRLQFLWSVGEGSTCLLVPGSVWLVGLGLLLSVSGSPLARSFVPGSDIWHGFRSEVSGSAPEVPGGHKVSP